MKRRILFVDDEPDILQGLRDRLRRLRKKWDMVFVESGRKALEALAETQFDVIVTDMRMPQMDGATLLRNVVDKHPEVTRIVLSGHAELAIALRVVPVAHQFLSKPCDPGLLENVVERALNLHALINNDAIHSIVSRVDSLPALPRVYSELVNALSDEMASLEVVANILKQDMAMCAKILQIVNSAFFRRSRSITAIEDAVAYLGSNTVKQLVLAVEVFGADTPRKPPGGISMDVLQQHSLLVASIASKMFKDKQRKEDAYAAALLHDIGKLLLITEMPQQVEEVAATMRETGVSMCSAEQQLFGVTHAEIGGYLLELWGLPYPVVEAVANHHAPNRVAQRDFDILAAVHIANILANEQMGPLVTGTSGESADLNLDYVNTLGVGDELETWREMARAQAEAAGLGRF